ncbi:hypothetical protein VST7929_00670 [Vibrio stylophorae]|uniref:Uncharacterized protein n=1 Tax=Vibrio stylophorae TaxID=659351 RepID=A0ABM8ZR97_9VIBR|nr:hypothetical protein [Vibrio stylophorae]CAH0532823.1 hypothetical protein VST7929_00670 [Vibrio stylophorae]
MKNLLILIMMFLSSTAHAVSEYSAVDDSIKNLINGTVKHLKVPDREKVKINIYNAVESIFDDAGKWNGYWLGYNELSASKIKETDVRYMEYIINTENNGFFFVSFLYDTNAKQILISQKQIRYGSSSGAFEVFHKRKSNTDTYKVIHEKNNFALLQQKGNVTFSAFNLFGEYGGVVFFNQVIIDL